MKHDAVDAIAKEGVVVGVDPGFLSAEAAFLGPGYAGGGGGCLLSGVFDLGAVDGAT